MKSILQAFAGFELRLGCSGSTSIRISCFPLNLPYQKPCLSFLPALRRVFRIQVKARACTERKKLIVLCPCPSHVYFGQDGQDLGLHPSKIPLFPIIQGKKSWVWVFWRSLSDKSNLALPWLPGIYSCTCEICIYDNRFPSIWGVSSLSTRNLIMHCTGIRCPQHSFSNGCAFYLFQSKISQLFLLKTAFLTSVGNAGCPHILATLHSLPERELEIKFLTCSVLSGTPFPPATALLCWANQAWDIFPVDLDSLRFSAMKCCTLDQMWLQWAWKFHCFLIPGDVWNRLLRGVWMSHPWWSSRPGWMQFGAIWEGGRYPWQGEEQHEL